MATERSYRISHGISAPGVQLTEVEGGAFDIVKLFNALRLVEEKDVDLVEIAPTARPLVYRLMDYSKFGYREQKKAHDVKLEQKVIQVREVRFHPGTDDNNHGVKLRNAARFLEDGNRVKVTLRFRGREMAHQELDTRVLERIKSDLEEFGQIEQVPKMEGHQAMMMLVSKKKK